jgi:hypothetical protein
MGNGAPSDGDLGDQQIGIDIVNNDLYYGKKRADESIEIVNLHKDLVKFIGNIAFARPEQTMYGADENTYDHRFITLAELKALAENLGFDYADIIEHLVSLVENYGVIIRDNKDLAKFFNGQYKSAAGNLITPENVRSILFKYPPAGVDQEEGLITYSSDNTYSFPDLVKIKSENGVKVRIEVNFNSEEFSIDTIKLEENNLILGPNALTVDETGDYVANSLIILNEQISPVIPLSTETEFQNNNTIETIDVDIPIIVGPDTLRFKVSQTNNNKTYNIDFSKFLTKNKLRKGTRYSFLIECSAAPTVPAQPNQEATPITITFSSLQSDISAGSYFSYNVNTSGIGGFRPVNATLTGVADVQGLQGSSATNPNGTIRNGVVNKVMLYAITHNVSFDVILGDGADFKTRFLTGVWKAKLRNIAEGGQNAAWIDKTFTLF